VNVAASEKATHPSSASELDELTLVRAQRGEDAACRLFVATYQRRVFALLGRMLAPSGRGALVEDLAQETFLRAFRALAMFDRGGPARLSTWLLTIATRLALDELKRAVPRLVPIDAIARGVAASGGGSDAASEADRRALSGALARAVAGLGPEQRATFLLREVHELSTEEVATALEVDLGTVKSRLSRAKQALRAALAEVHDE
jgi:RNA polymerase sigma-70 factor (ECF subfamily)